MVGPPDILSEHPARVGMLSVLPVLLAGMQVANALVYDLPLALPLAFSAVLVAFAIAAYVSLEASFEVAVLEERWHD